MATVNTFEELDIWELGREICQDVWDALTKSADERNDLSHLERQKTPQ